MKTLADVWEELSYSDRDHLLTFVRAIPAYKNAHMGIMPLISFDYLRRVVSSMDIEGIRYWAEKYNNATPLMGALVIDRLQARERVRKKRGLNERTVCKDTSL